MRRILITQAFLALLCCISLFPVKPSSSVRTCNCVDVVITVCSSVMYIKASTPENFSQQGDGDACSGSAPHHGQSDSDCSPGSSLGCGPAVAALPLFLNAAQPVYQPYCWDHHTLAAKVELTTVLLHKFQPHEPHGLLNLDDWQKGLWPEFSFLSG